jgi:hypothetical protein
MEEWLILNNQGKEVHRVDKLTDRGKVEIYRMENRRASCK